MNSKATIGSPIRLLLILPLFLVLSPVFAQEAEAVDPFADYSYLWEKPKKSKKEKGKGVEKVEDQSKDTLPTQPVKADTLVTPTRPPVIPPVAVDSTFAAPLAADTSIVKSDTLRMPADSLQITPEVEEPRVEPRVEPEVEAQEDPEAQENKGNDEAEIGEPKEKREIAPIAEDFRAGLPEGEAKGSFTGGVTYTKIGDENFVGLVLSPEFKIWKIGLGLNVPILYGLESQAVRTEIFEGGVGVARLVRYIRLGSQKRDPIYVRVGELNNTMIGFGGLVNNYTNTTSFEKRKMGVHYDMNFRGLVGLEGMYSDFDAASMNLLVVRPYVRPLAWTIIPIVRTLEIGATYITDKDQTKKPVSDSTFVVNQFTRDGVGATGLDAGINLLRVPFIQIDAFFSYGRLNVATAALTDSIQAIGAAQGEPINFTNGSGISGGINFRFNFIADILSTDMRIERLTYTANYLPQFFDASYELNKDARLLSLASADKMSGIYGSLTGHILQKVQLGGSLLLPDEISETAPAVLRLNADVERLGDKVSLHGSYIKGNLSDLGDAFKLDENSLAKVRFIYHMNKFLVVGLDYYWAFAPTEDGSYKATSYVSPYFGVSIKF